MTEEVSSKICAAMQNLECRGLSTGTAGNISARCKQDILITPSGLLPNDIVPSKIVTMSLSGTWEGDWKPSSEWQIHTEIYNAFPETGAIIHVHSPYATALSCHGKEVPAFHYMVAAIGGNSIRCAPYETFGTKKLSKVVLTALESRLACLMANHGMLAIGVDIDKSFNTVLLVEELCKQYIFSNIIGEPSLIPEIEMGRVSEKFKSYGVQDV